VEVFSKIQLLKSYLEEHSEDGEDSNADLENSGGTGRGSISGKRGSSSRSWDGNSEEISSLKVEGLIEGKSLGSIISSGDDSSCSSSGLNNIVNSEVGQRDNGDT